MKLAFTVVVDLHDETSAAEANTFGRELLTYARTHRRTRDVSDVHATLDLDIVDILTREEPSRSLSEVLDLSLPFMMAVRKADLSEAQARAFLAALPRDHAPAMVDEARRLLLRESNASARKR